MKTWTYDGSLDGLFALVERAYQSGEYPAFVVNRARPELDLFAASESTPGKSGERPEQGRAAEEVRESSRRLYVATLKVWMSEESVEPALLAIAADLGRRGEAALGDWSRPELATLVASVRRVDREIHRLVGLARFSRRQDGLYAAPLEPDHDVLPALTPHFLRRFRESGMDFALIDLKRSYAILIRQGRLERLSGQAALALLPDGTDAAESALWKSYFRATENPARRNPALQRRLMPARYWKHLTELSSA